jgi:AraC family transcriptional regulator
MTSIASSLSRNESPVVRTASTNSFILSERHYEPHVASPRHAHVKDYIIVTLAGRYFSTFDTRTEEFKPWTVSFHQAGTSHTSRYDPNGAKVLYIEVPNDRLKRLWGVCPSHLAHFSLRGGVVEWTARQLYSELKTGDAYSSIVMDGLVIQMLAHLLRRRSGRGQCLPAWLGNADEIIRRRFAEPLGLVDIAQLVNVHPVHLAREYRRHYDCTIGEQIRRLRIEYACEQLSNSDLSLAEIGLSAGFADQSHFTTSFRQQIGTAPSHFRKAARTKLGFEQNASSAQDQGH